MKRICMTLALVLAVSVILSCGVFAAGLTASSQDGSLTYDSTSGKYTAGYDEKLVDGNSYVLLVVEGSAGNYAISEDSLLYIDQVDDCDGSSVSFDFIPMRDEEAVVLLGGEFTDNSNVRILGTIKSAGVAVSGTVTSYGVTTNNVTITLSDGTNTYTDTVSGGAANVAWSFEDVPAGTYTLTVEKKGCAPYTESITVDAAVTGKAVTIYLLGDVNRNGSHNSADTTMVKRIVAGTFTPDAQQFVLADMNKNGGHNSADTTILKRIVAGTYSLE